jgi:hypothetical protein
VLGDVHAEAGDTRPQPRHQQLANKQFRHVGAERVAQVRGDAEGAADKNHAHCTDPQGERARHRNEKELKHGLGRDDRAAHSRGRVQHLLHVHRQEGELEGIAAESKHAQNREG